MKLPVCFGDRVDIQQAVFAALGGRLRTPAMHALTVDAAVDHHMRDMQPKRPEFTRHALRDHPQPCFCSGEMREAGFATQARRRAREDHRAAAKRRKTPRGFPTDQKTADGP